MRRLSNLLATRVGILTVAELEGLLASLLEPGACEDYAITHGGAKLKAEDLIEITKEGRIRKATPDDLNRVVAHGKTGMGLPYVSPEARRIYREQTRRRLEEEARRLEQEAQRCARFEEDARIYHLSQRKDFSPVVDAKAWELLRKYMTERQHSAFTEGAIIELENEGGKYRLLIEKTGDFQILEGERGGAITSASGTIHSHDFPLGDEIAAFIDWFRFRTDELIANWNCGTYGIVKEK